MVDTTTSTFVCQTLCLLTPISIDDHNVLFLGGLSAYHSD